MTIRIAVAGKGGTGKTTFAALLIRGCLKQNKIPLLAVDADPNSNLSDLLGMNYQTTIADVREEVRNISAIPAGMSKSDYLNMRLNEIVTESKGVDLIVMGRPEGRECYCYVNELLRGFLSNISKQYACVIIDNEAGMEHLSRRTTDDIDVLFILSEPTAVSLQSAVRVYETAKKIKLNIKKTYLVMNKTETVDQNIVQNFSSASSHTTIEVIGWLPYDKTIFQLSEKGGNLLSLSDNLPIVSSVDSILNKI
ncbi:MAG: AAA family ATPase [Elusimicrobiota bacterium]|nr:AAA family ATPase [Elusimicrobiota bacterium]